MTTEISPAAVEAVSRALAASDGFDPNLCHNVSGTPIWAQYRGEAEEALTAVLPHLTDAALASGLVVPVGEAERLTDLHRETRDVAAGQVRRALDQRDEARSDHGTAVTAIREAIHLIDLGLNPDDDMSWGARLRSIRGVLDAVTPREEKR